MKLLRYLSGIYGSNYEGKPPMDHCRKTGEKSHIKGGLFTVLWFVSKGIHPFVYRRRGNKCGRGNNHKTHLHSKRKKTPETFVPADHHIHGTLICYGHTKGKSYKSQNNSKNKWIRKKFHR